MRVVRRLFGDNSQLHVLVVLLFVLLAVFNMATGGRMVTTSNAQNLVTGNAYVLILAVGMVLVIVIGQIDLSVGSVAAFVSMTAALAMYNLGLPWWVGLLLGLLLGALIGAWQGFWLAAVGIPGFITTLAGMMIFRGALLWESQALSIPVPDEWRFMGAGYLPEWGPTWTGMNNSTLVLGLVVFAYLAAMELRRYRRRVARGGEVEGWVPATRIVLMALAVGAVTWLFGQGPTGTSFPVSGVILLLLVFGYHVVTRRTAFGRHVYAVGGNPGAAALSGVNIQAVQFAVMVNMGVLAALAGMVFAGRATAAGPQDGNLWELDAIAAVFIGGAAVGGGMGTIYGAVMGGLVMAVLNNGLMLLGVSSDRAQVIKGLVLLAAVSFDLYSRRKGRPSLTGRMMEGLRQNQTPSLARFQ
ncbi:ABC transporter permease subunit [Actinomyces polynesiensis]|uniref:ABC transporter permease subunit n=1 Tax=Actinomyces polynesiensis TaxID=1325934 RepID=UPI0005B79E8C|nr:sugar ABC transporter permease [Actinomyces polynesiensis]